jgi:hypothetical protein
MTISSIRSAISSHLENWASRLGSNNHGQTPLVNQHDVQTRVSHHSDRRPLISFDLSRTRTQASDVDEAVGCLAIPLRGGKALVGNKPSAPKCENPTVLDHIISRLPVKVWSPKPSQPSQSERAERAEREDTGVGTSEPGHRAVGSGHPVSTEPSSAGPDIICNIPTETFLQILNELGFKEDSARAVTPLRLVNKYFKEHADRLWVSATNRETFLKSLEGASVITISVHAPGILIKRKDSKKIATLRHLKQLNLSHCRINGASVENILALRHLEDLDLTGVNIYQPSVLEKIGEMQHLKSLNLSHNRLDDSIGRFLAESRSLTKLNLANTSIGSAVSDLAGIETLELLDLSSNRLMHHASALQNFRGQVLHLNACGISADVVADLAKSPHVRELELSRNDIGDIGARAIAGNKMIMSLSLRGCKIGGRRLANNLRHATIGILGFAKKSEYRQ